MQIRNIKVVPGTKFNETVLLDIIDKFKQRGNDWMPYKTTHGSGFLKRSLLRKIGVDKG